MTLDRVFWEKRWAEVLRQHGDELAQRQPNAHLLEIAADLRPGLALDAGCGNGSEALWLAARGWQVTAVDFSAAALEHGRRTASRLGPEIAERIDWVEADLHTWTPAAAAHDLVISLYVHVAGSVDEAIGRLGHGVAPGGLLVLVGHLPVDPVTGAATPAAGQVQVSVPSATSALVGPEWSIEIAEERERTAIGSGYDAVVVARRVVHAGPDDPGPFFHGTKADLRPGGLLEPGWRSNYGTRRRANHIYFSATIDAAAWGAELAVGEGDGRIYEVTPTGPFENDPNLTDQRFPGNPTRSYRTRSPLRVVGEVRDWTGHAPEVVRAMRDRLAELDKQGVEAIDD